MLGASFNIVKNLLDVNMNLNIFGAYEDPNRVPTGIAGTSAAPAPTSSARRRRATSDLTFDRLTPVANLQLGFRLRFLHDRLQFSAQFYNVLNQHYYYPDFFNDLTPTIEMTPTAGARLQLLRQRLSYHF